MCICTATEFTPDYGGPVDTDVQRIAMSVDDSQVWTYNHYGGVDDTVGYWSPDQTWTDFCNTNFGIGDGYDTPRDIALDDAFVYLIVANCVFRIARTSEYTFYTEFSPECILVWNNYMNRCWLDNGFLYFVETTDVFPTTLYALTKLDLATLATTTIVDPLPTPTGFEPPNLCIDNNGIIWVSIDDTIYQYTVSGTEVTSFAVQSLVSSQIADLIFLSGSVYVLSQFPEAHLVKVTSSTVECDLEFPTWTDNEGVVVATEEEVFLGKNFKSIAANGTVIALGNEGPGG